MKVALAQIAPVLLDGEATLSKVVGRAEEAAAAGCRLCVFGEAVLPGYPLWLSRTGGARFNDPDQKRLHELYAAQAIDLDTGPLDSLVRVCREGDLSVILGIVERPPERGGHSLYCSRVFIQPETGIASVHRKLMPTYEERLAWGPGDGAGLVTHPVGPFTVGALNCWENWMPLARAALYAAGEDLHVMLWPGDRRLTADITRFVALEARSFVVSVGAVIRDRDIPKHLPMREHLSSPGETLYDGGSCIAGPDGRWIVEPVANEETLIVADLDPAEVGRERQNFDASGHYSRPDVLRLVVDRRRQSPVDWID